MIATFSSADQAKPSDEQLLLDYRATGKSDLFSALVQRYEGELYGYLNRFIGDATMAEDVFQATFLKLHLKCDQFREGLKVRPWLYRIATNQAIDAMRLNRRHRMTSLDQSRGTEESDMRAIRDLLVSDTPAPANRLEIQEQSTSVRQAAGKLPEPLREIVTLVYFKGLKYREAAEVLAIPLGTLKSRMNAALRMLGELCPAHLAPTE